MDDSASGTTTTQSRGGGAITTASTALRGVEREVEECARQMFIELTGGAPRPEPWYRWYLCERHGGSPLLDPYMPVRQVAYWDGCDIVIATRAPLPEIL